MKDEKYKRFKHIAKATAIAVMSTILLSGCASTPNETDKEEELYVNHNGSFIPYMMFMRSNMGGITSGTGFATKSADGKFESYKPSSNEISSMQKGNFTGKVSRPTINKAASPSTKSFGGSSSRGSSIGG